MADDKMCPCGRPLHYIDPHLQKRVEGQVAELGELIRVKNVETQRIYLVPRHFIALHPIKGGELDALAERFGFEEVQ